MSDKPIYEIVDELPEGGMTVMLLKALDFVVPGQWQNVVGFENSLRVYTGTDDQEYTQAVGDRVVQLFNDTSNGYQRALWLYSVANSAGGMLGTAAMANKLGESVSFLGFLDKITPKADTAQSIDFTLKTVIELLCFCQINGIPGDSIGDFVGALGEYGGDALMRMAAIISVDGLLPLGPDFLKLGDAAISRIADFESNPIFGKVASYIPGGDSASKVGFIGQAFGSVRDWMDNFVQSRGLTREGIVGSVRNYIDITDDKLDYVGAFLDMTTNYYEHTGVQTLTRRMIERAMGEV